MSELPLVDLLGVDLGAELSADFGKADLGTSTWVYPLNMVVFLLLTGKKSV